MASLVASAIAEGFWKQLAQTAKKFITSMLLNSC